MSATVDARGVGVRFQFDRQRRVLSPTLARFRRAGGTVWALRALDLQVARGEGVALVGPTGSGKTTLLRVLGGILTADEGTVAVEGRIGTLLATDAGLLGLLTGRENTELLGVLSGLSLREARAAVGRVEELSRLGAAYDLPVSTYSHGMRARLGFAVAAQRDVDVLLLDEVHEALDREFRAVMAERTRAIRECGGIVIAAGHDHHALAAMCDRAVQLDAGSVVGDDVADSVLA